MNIWLWRVEVANRRDSEVPCDAILIQDLGLGDRGFLMNNEAYASQYLDHHVARHSRLNYVLMSRQNLSQGGAYPWAAHGCLEGAAGFATDFRQVMGPAHRDADQFMVRSGLACLRPAYSSRRRARPCNPRRDAGAGRGGVVDVLWPL